MIRINAGVLIFTAGIISLGLVYLSKVESKPEPVPEPSYTEQSVAAPQSVLKTTNDQQANAIAVQNTAPQVSPVKQSVEQRVDASLGENQKADTVVVKSEFGYTDAGAGTPTQKAASANAAYQAYKAATGR